MNQTYRALTRTYRPRTFDDIVSQEHVSSTLKNAILQNRLSHAYMFCGPRGVGKTTMARVLAREVNQIDAGVDGESLNQTLNIVEMDAASNRKIEDVRSLKEVIRVPPQQGKYKIFIIDEVHMLTKEAFNALLKTLEEPPPHAIFIFATTEPHKVLPTILSRVQRFDFKRISVPEIVGRLQAVSENEKITIDEESLHVIAKRADGALRDALGLMDQAIAFCGDTITYKELLQALNVVDKEYLFSFIEAVRSRDAKTGLTLIQELLQAGTDIQEFLVSLTEHVRNLYVAHQSDRFYLVEATEETKKRYEEQASNFSEDDLMRMLFLISEAQMKMKEAQQPRVRFEILLLKLVHMHRSVELDVLLKDLEEVKKKYNGQVSAENNGKSRSVGNGNREDEEALAEAESEPDSDPGREADSETGNNSLSVSADTGVSIQTGEVEKPESAGLEADDPGSSAESGELEPEDENIFGTPTLSPRSSGGAVRGGQQSEHSPAPEPDVEKESPKREFNGMKSVTERWNQFLERAKANVPGILFFQFQRVGLKRLQGRELVVSVDNEFARRMIEEHRMLLCKLMKEEFGVRFQLTCTIERAEKEENGALSPYERFHQLQKEDPNLRALVELFGAELEY
ncbi:MAG: DNA polymerase III subunit gamma/tau [Balneolaceae bacterium]